MSEKFSDKSEVVKKDSDNSGEGYPVDAQCYKDECNSIVKGAIDNLLKHQEDFTENDISEYHEEYNKKIRGEVVSDKVLKNGILIYSKKIESLINNPSKWEELRTALGHLENALDINDMLFEEGGRRHLDGPLDGYFKKNKDLKRGRESLVSTAKDCREAYENMEDLKNMITEKKPPHRIARLYKKIDKSLNELGEKGIRIDSVKKELAMLYVPKAGGSEIAMN